MIYRHANLTPHKVYMGNVVIWDFVYKHIFCLIYVCIIYMYDVFRVNVDVIMTSDVVMTSPLTRKTSYVYIIHTYLRQKHVCTQNHPKITLSYIVTYT